MRKQIHLLNQLKIFTFLVVAFLCVIFFAPTYADDVKSFYVTTAQLPPELLVPPPHENTDAEDKQLSLVHAAQKNISASDLAALRDEQHVHLEMMTSVLGPDFTRAQLPKTFTLLDHVMHDTGTVTEADKQFWDTRRPYLVDRRIKLLVEPIDQSPAYPSGHTCVSRVLAEVLGMLVPDQRDALRAKADSIATHRVMAGVHYPADIEGGRALAMLMVGAMTANDDFKADTAASRAELLAHAQVGK